jgi:hypothetical protein
MRRLFSTVVAVMLLAMFASAAPISNAARAVIPAEVQQLIVVDYRSLNNFPTALALKDRLLPAPLKEFEKALRGAGINPESDVEQLVFASFRAKDGVRVVGIAQGEFPGQKVLLRLKKQKVKPELYHTAKIYPMGGGGMNMTLLDASTMVFGETSVIKTALDTRDNSTSSLNANPTVLDLMQGVETETVWSVLDKAGTNTMLKSALGDAAELADYDTIRKRLIGSRYKMNFNKGVGFDLDVITSDSITAAMLSSVLRAGVMFRKATASDSEKMALESVNVKSESKDLLVQFRSDDNKFQSLLNSDLFAAIAK